MTFEDVKEERERAIQKISEIIAEQIDFYYYCKAIKKIHKKGKVYIWRIYFYNINRFIRWFKIEREDITDIVNYMRKYGISTPEEFMSRKGESKC